MNDYQWNKAIGRVFRSQSDSYTGYITILGIPYVYKVIQGTPQKNKLLEVLDFQENELYCKVFEGEDEGGFKYV